MHHMAREPNHQPIKRAFSVRHLSLLLACTSTCNYGCPFPDLRRKCHGRSINKLDRREGKVITTILYTLFLGLRIPFASCFSIWFSFSFLFHCYSFSFSLRYQQPIFFYVWDILAAFTRGYLQLGLLMSHYQLINVVEVAFFHLSSCLSDCFLFLFYFTLRVLDDVYFLVHTYFFSRYIVLFQNLRGYALEIPWHYYSFFHFSRVLLPICN